MQSLENRKEGTATPLDDVALTVRQAQVSSDAAMPAAVAQTCSFFRRHGLWHILGRNPPVRSCREAAAHRYRLGKRGIPLRDELRSYLAQGTDSSGRPAAVLFHCRGDQQLLFDALGRLDLGVHDLSRASIQSLGDANLDYGLINPFMDEHRAKAINLVRQVFDCETVDGLGQTGTMMTNAGDFTWSMEFEPRALIRALGDNAVVAQIAVREPSASSSEREGAIGIITGNGPESGALLWRKINIVYRQRMGREFAGDVSYPRVLIHSLPAMGWSMELDSRAEPLWLKIEQELNSLADAGATAVALACNTTQFFSHRIETLFENKGVKFVRLADAIRAFLDGAQSNSTYVLGIGHVLDGTSWSDFRFLEKYPQIFVPGEADIETIERLAYEIKQDGPTSKALQKLKTIVRRAPCDQVLLLLTELSVLFEQYRFRISKTKKIHDGLDLYANHIVDIFLR